MGDSIRKDFFIDTDEIETSIKAEVKEACKQIEAKLLEEFGEEYGLKQTKLSEFE